MDVKPMRATLHKDPMFKLPICPDDTLRIAPAYSGGDDRMVVKVLEDGPLVRWRRVGWLDEASGNAVRDCNIASVRAITAGNAYELPLNILYEEAQSGGLVQQTLD